MRNKLIKKMSLFHFFFSFTLIGFKMQNSIRCFKCDILQIQPTWLLCVEKYDCTNLAL